MKIKLLTGLLLLIAVLIYVFQNGSLVPIHFLKWEYAISQALLVLSSLLIGVILGLLLSYVRRNKEKNAQKKAEKKAKKLKRTEEKLKKQQEKQQKPEEQQPVVSAEENHDKDQEQV
ncbi:lipopolysaccharide assembly protein LapA domain-containing protein [uncultured Desulfuromusa sp.]|uniref:lipopolysaccharide assembly protein LapA domain-containing protein n=1 Tax=uncultured Desulfuromusa sp. TaxID=219183 RepID=UPI002AA7F861|nr:lipopolysaccharide assembly protein LapA domain-containing protein [uncultured Desulfuromusa sp.]